MNSIALKASRKTGVEGKAFTRSVTKFIIYWSYISSSLKYNYGDAAVIDNHQTFTTFSLPQHL